MGNYGQIYDLSGSFTLNTVVQIISSLLACKNLHRPFIILFPYVLFSLQMSQAKKKQPILI